MSDTHPTPTSPYFNLQRNIQYLERSLDQRGRIHHVHRFQEHGTSTILQHATNTRQTPSDEAKLLGGLSTVEQRGQNRVQPSSGGIMSEGRTLVPVCRYCREESSYSFEIKISCCFNIHIFNNGNHLLAASLIAVHCFVTSPAKIGHDLFLSEWICNMVFLYFLPAQASLLSAMSASTLHWSPSSS